MRSKIGSWLPYSTYLYLDFHLLCSMAKLKEHSREICYKIGLRPLGGLLSPKGFPLLRRPLAPPCRVLHGLSFKKQLTTEQGVPLRVTTTCSPWCWTLLLRPGSRTPPPGEKRIDVVRLVGADLIDGELANRLILLPGVYNLPFISIFILIKNCHF